MYDFLGVTQNWAAIENQPWTMRWRFLQESEENAEEPMNLDGVTFHGVVKGEDFESELSFEQSKEKDERHVIIVSGEGLPEGRHYYEVWARAESGHEDRLVSGHIGVVASTLEKLEGNLQTYAGRTLALRFPGDSTRHVRLEWDITTQAQLAADMAVQSAKEAADSATNAKASEGNAKASEDSAASNATVARDSAEAAKEAAKTAQEAEGKSSFDLWQELHPGGTVEEYLEGLRGKDGKDGKDGIGSEAELDKIYSRKTETEEKINEAKQEAQQALEAAKQELQSDIAEQLSAVYNLKGSVDTYGDLPKSGMKPHDTYHIKEDGRDVYWKDDGGWDDLGLNLEGVTQKKDFEAHKGDEEAHLLPGEKEELVKKESVQNEYKPESADPASGQAIKQALAEWQPNGHSFGDAIVYEFVIDANDENPNSRVIYPMGARNYLAAPVGMDFAHDVFRFGDWTEDAFFMPKPVMLKFNGTVEYELNKNDYSLKTNGEQSDIADLTHRGNVQIAWPQVWLKFAWEGRWMHVYIANKQVDDSFHAYAHYNRNRALLPEIYTMAYQPCKDTTGVGTTTSPLLRSMSGQAICVNNTGSNEILWAENTNNLGDAGGAHWSLWDYGMVMLINTLLTLIGKSTNFQAVFGDGRSSGANNKTGEADKKGMFYGTQGNGMLKVFGIENYYGNYWKRMNGLCYSATHGVMYKMTESTIDGSSGQGYAKSGSDADCVGYLKDIGLITGGSGGYIKGCTLNERGIFPKVTGGAANTYWCDGCWYAGGGFALVGGCYGDGALGGGFTVDLYYAVSDAGGAIGGSLSCKPDSL